MKIINELLNDKENFVLLDKEEGQWYLFMDQKTLKKMKILPVTHDKVTIEYI